MANFKKYLHQLIAKIDSSTSNHTHFQVAVPEPDFDIIDWLASQTLYPKFYWQDRKGREQAICLGEVAKFSDLTHVYSILSGEQRIWGGRAFPSHNEGVDDSTYFFLPLIELIKNEAQWQLKVNVGEDPELALYSLNQLSWDVKPQCKLIKQRYTLYHQPEHPQWVERVEHALHTIRNSELDKVVLARKTRVQLEHSVSAFQLLKASLQHNHHCYHFLFAIDKSQYFIGASPERLYRRQGLKVETEALAGTIGRGRNDIEDSTLAHWLINDAKNRYENQLVVEDIEQRLSPYCESVTVSPQPSLLKLRQVQHLKTVIKAQLRVDIPKFWTIDALQPTAAVAGLPRLQAKSFIEQHEEFSRHWYAGSVGYISQQRAELSVAIRSALFDGHEYQLYAGAGIVEGSDPEHEWQELGKKMATLLSLLTYDDI